MNKRYGWAVGSALLMALTTVGARAADSLDVLRYAISGGTPSLNLRSRYEHVEQSKTPHLGNAYTVRARLGYTTGKWNDLDLLTEFEGTFPLGNELYNSTTNGHTNRATIADPKGTELNQLVLRYAGLPGTALKLGRQRITLDNDRFIGNVGWRQNEATFDAFSVVNTLIPKATLTYDYLARVNTIFYSSYQITGHLLNAAYAWSPALNLVAYGYLLDFDVNTAARPDTQTYGLRASGAVPFSDFKFLYTAEYANQSQYKNAPASVGASYYLAEAGGAYKSVSAKLGYEVLGGDGTYGFQTPLATLHAFQGWADLFLVTPKTGIRDAYLRAEGDALGLKLLGFYHDFRADSGGMRYGGEFDVQAVKLINDAFSVMVKYADYNADAFAVDTRKTWVQAEYKF